MSLTYENVKGLTDELGLEIDEQSAFYKVGSGQARVYVAKAKRVNRVDLSGFTVSHPAVEQVEGEGNVQGRIKTKDDEQALSALRLALETVKLTQASSPTSEDEDVSEDASDDDAAATA